MSLSVYSRIKFTDKIILWITDEQSIQAVNNQSVDLISSFFYPKFYFIDQILVFYHSFKRLYQMAFNEQRVCSLFSLKNSIIQTKSTAIR